jgi:hypothetical protein
MEYKEKLIIIKQKINSYIKQLDKLKNKLIQYSS